jgi:hypothetical protein
MNDGIVESEIGLIYSLLLPDQIQVALNLYWGEAPLLDKLAQSDGAALHLGASTRKADLSLWRCRRLARRAGLRVGDAFAVIPSLERPTAMISTRGDAAKVFYSRGRTQLLDKLPHWARVPVRVLDALNARVYLEPTFVILAHHD